ncbi:diguanylate cyclase (GGDEF)-like protein [Variovorax sp. TBS-050B]|uniref:sensor domain-containing diguanylate cyclase n=1 Tax=Variovorax sp. TBS-050B TaxID=2940551 RepID=UPI0024761EF6|nr:diguanylate cyclase [Variovorax sp. TBS-050B]MDH6590163.1 diguanylate cyclase (GGDEF)-like protein [Variovorax sp. TBS-050B]
MRKNASPVTPAETPPDSAFGPWSANDPTALARKTDRQRSRVIAGTTLFVVFVCLALLVMNAWLIVRARTAEDEQIARANTNLARAVSQQIESTVVLAEHILSGIVFELERADITPDTLQRLQPVLVNHATEVQAIKGLFIYDAEGRWLVHSEAYAAGNRNNSDRAYFIQHRDSPSTRTLISAPIVSRSSGEWVIPVSRRINDPDGNFAGVVLVTLSVRHLLDLLERFQIGEQGAIALFRSDQLLVRRPFKEADLGKRTPGSPLQQRFQAARSGTVEGRSSIDGVKRIISFEHLPDYPLLVTVAVGKDEALQEWKSASIYQTSWVVLLCLVIGVAGRYLVRSMRKRLVAELHLRSARDALTEANERLEHLAQEDGLTGLANRRAFDARLLQNFEQAKASRTPLAVVMVDVDEFKKYNDLYGHLEGDECLRQVARALRTAVWRAGDLAARYGGEEMVLLLPATDAEGAHEVAQRVRLAVFDLRIPHAASALGTVSVSLGVAAWVPEPDSTPFELLRAADEALYVAKQEGRNAVRVHA